MPTVTPFTGSRAARLDDRCMKKTLVIGVLVSSFWLSGCVAVGLTALGVGMATGVSHQLGGMVYKTFTTNESNVKRATYGAFRHMQVKVVKSEKKGSIETIVAKAGDREIQVELEALTPNTTRMMVTAKQDGGILRDGATATEVILQTEKLVGST